MKVYYIGHLLTDYPANHDLTNVGWEICGIFETLEEAFENFREDEFITEMETNVYSTEDTKPSVYFWKINGNIYDNKEEIISIKDYLKNDMK